jgi:DNA-binding NarL/FixJ family response regulator
VVWLIYDFEGGSGMTRSGSGGEFLARRSDVVQGKNEVLPALRDIVLVEDFEADADRLTALLHIVLGREAVIRVAKSLDKAIDAVLKATPDLMILDDYLEPSDSALDTIPLVRRAGYEGPIIILSGELDRARGIALKKAGASGTIHKDNVNSVELGGLLVQVFSKAG